MTETPKAAILICLSIPSSLPSAKIARVLFGIHDNEMVLLHGFIKKSQKTPKTESTSRAALDRLLDPKNTSVTLHTLERAAFVIGRRLRIELADA